MKPLVTDELWQRVEPLLPPPPQRRARFPGRKPLDYRKVLTGILFVLKSGIGWADLPAELGCGCGKTCRSYLLAWQQAGVWQRLHQVLLTELDEAGQIDWSRAALDAAFAKAPLGGADTGPNPTDRSKSGSKHHILVDGQTSTDSLHTAAELFRALDGEDAVVIAHVGGRYADIKLAHDGRLERTVEVHSTWGTFEWLLHDAFEKGYRVGVVCHSDDHKGRPGATRPGASTFGAIGGLTCYLMPELSRDALFAASLEWLQNGTVEGMATGEIRLAKD